MTSMQRALSMLTDVSEHRLEVLTHDQLRNLVRDLRGEAEAALTGARFSPPALAIELNVLGGQIARFVDEALPAEATGFKARVRLALLDYARQVREVELQLRAGLAPLAALDAIAKIAWHSEDEFEPVLSNADRWRIVALCRDAFAAERDAAPQYRSGTTARFNQVAQRTMAFLRYGWNVRCAVSGADLWVLDAPYAMGNATWHVSENGGEVQVRKPNTDVDVPVPYTAHGLALNAATMAYRIACVLGGREIDYDVVWPDSDFLGPEVKLSADGAEEVAATLRRLSDQAGHGR